MPSAVVGATLAAASAVYGGVTAAESASYQGHVAKNNATAARQNAAYSASASSANTESAGLKAAQKLGAVTAGQAANNLDVNTGSAADVSTSQREMGQLDVDNEATRGALATYGYQTQASNFDAQARADKAQVVPDIAGGLLKAGGSIASSAGQLGIGGSGSGGGGAYSEFGGSGWTSGSGDGFGGASLLSGAVTAPSGYSWMQTDGGNLGADDNWDN